MRELFERPLRLPRLRPYVPAPEDPRIFWFNSERDGIIRETVRRVVARHGGDPRRLELVLNDAAFYETERLARQDDAEARRDLPRFKALSRRVARLSKREKQDVLTDLATRIARDIAGNFDPRVYGMAERAVPKLLTGVMSPTSLPADLFDPANTRIDQLLRTEGDVEHLRTLCRRGTVVYVPTHSSNLDSIVLGYALLRERLPPVVYGAGKNLFSNPLISFFMHNLGAYRVDRRVRATLYKDVLKAYSTVMIERGFHSLFFPGGGRSRSGRIERKLKLGLAGTAIEAFSRNQVRGVATPVYFVPTTINYVLVLEAESLIQEHLRDMGGPSYVLDRDESTELERWVRFFRSLVELTAACVIRFGTPVDAFGNEISPDGSSLGPEGRPIDPGSYVRSGGRPTVDPARDAAYTRELGELLVDRYRRETVVMAPQLVAHLLYRRIVRETPGVDVFGRMRLRGETLAEMDELEGELGHARDALGRLAGQGQVHVSRYLREAPPGAILRRALDTWEGYHTRPPARIVGRSVEVDDPTLLLFYGNRLAPFAEHLADGDSAEAAREIVAPELRA